jgi:glucose-6-phosphate isomerase
LKERETIGYYDLPYQDTSDIKAYTKTIAQKHIVVVGIGGSSLGVKAIYGRWKISSLEWI